MNERENKKIRVVFVFAAAGLAALLLSVLARRVWFMFAVAGLLCFGVALLCATALPQMDSRLGKAARVLRRTLLCLAAAGLVSFVWIEALIVSGWPDNEAVEADCLIVLGAGLYGDRLSAVLRSRVSLAADYLLENPGCVAIVTGGQGPGETITEALAMQRYLISRGVAESRVIMEDRAHNTIENLRFSIELLESHGLSGKQIAVVSNSFHLYRAGWLAGRLGLEAQTLGAPTPSFPFTPLNSYLREYFSVLLMYAKALAGALA